MTWRVWQREIIAAIKVVETTSEEGCNKGVLWGLKRVWPPAVGYGHGRIEAEEESCAAAAKDMDDEVGEGACVAGAAEEEVIGSCSIVERERGDESALVNLGLWYQVENNRMC